MTLMWGGACRPKQGQSVSGDVYVCEEYTAGRVLASVIDGLGGGAEAERAAVLAAQTLRQHPEVPLQELVRRAHTALHGTRGAVIGVMRLELGDQRLSFVGVGNIGVHVYSRQPIRPISKNGILGFRMPTLLEMRYAFDAGDLFVLYSDGISSHFTQDTTIDLKQPPQRIAEQVLAAYGKSNDDATVLVIKTVAMV